MTDLNYRAFKIFPTPIHYINLKNFNDMRDDLIKYAYDLKNEEDGIRIIEQIIPFFTPEYTVSMKLMEDLKVNYDMTVRNNKNKIVQFSYGSDNFEPTRIENQTLPLTNMTLEEIFAHFKMPSNEDTDVFNINFIYKIKFPH